MPIFGGNTSGVLSAQLTGTITAIPSTNPLDPIGGGYNVLTYVTGTSDPDSIITGGGVSLRPGFRAVGYFLTFTSFPIAAGEILFDGVTGDQGNLHVTDFTDTVGRRMDGFITGILSNESLALFGIPDWWVAQQNGVNPLDVSFILNIFGWP